MITCRWRATPTPDKYLDSASPSALFTIKICTRFDSSTRSQLRKGLSTIHLRETLTRKLLLLNKYGPRVYTMSSDLKPNRWQQLVSDGRSGAQGVPTFSASAFSTAAIRNRWAAEAQIHTLCQNCLGTSTREEARMLHHPSAFIDTSWHASRKCCSPVDCGNGNWIQTAMRMC